MKEEIKNKFEISNKISSLDSIAQQLTENLKRLNEFNKIRFVIDQKFIYELTFKKLNEIKKEINKDIFDPSVNDKIQNIIKLLFTPIEFKNKNDIFFTDYTELYQLNSYVGFENSYINKDSFDFDYKNKNVKVKDSIIKQIEIDNTIIITDKKQLKVIEIIKNIEKEYNEINNLVDDNALVYKLYKSTFTKDNSIIIDRLSLYYTILNK